MCQNLSIKKHYDHPKIRRRYCSSMLMFCPAFFICLDITSSTFVSVVFKTLLCPWEPCAYMGVKKQYKWFISHFQSNLAAKLHLESEWFLCNIDYIKGSDCILTCPKCDTWWERKHLYWFLILHCCVFMSSTKGLLL